MATFAFKLPIIVLENLLDTNEFVWLQNKVEPKMDEAKNYGAAQLSHTEETTIEEGRLLS